MRLPVAIPIAFGLAAVFAGLWLRERAIADDEAELAAGRLATVERRHLGERAELRRRIADLEGELALARPLAAPGLQLVTVRGAAGGYVHLLGDPAARRWLALAVDLPPPGPSEAYQLWLVPPDGAPRSAALFRVLPEGLLATTFEVPADLDGAVPAVSREPAGGARGAPRELLMRGDLPL